ncbi:nudC domain-containing protein 3 isoform X1 [Phoca vitulina]|uniref:nudC domain-containing protein 3 isoform X1 n=1 Tax=Phoca vitulina TaxID=9720 RepID=UPI0013960E03|nr:nudC domain-containing protein 3 isoform X1 [Phoca vitulina]
MWGTDWSKEPCVHVPALSHSAAGLEAVVFPPGHWGGGALGFQARQGCVRRCGDSVGWSRARGLCLRPAVPVSLDSAWARRRRERQPAGASDRRPWGERAGRPSVARDASGAASCGGTVASWGPKEPLPSRGCAVASGRHSLGGGSALRGSAVVAPVRLGSIFSTGGRARSSRALRGVGGGQSALVPRRVQSCAQCRQLPESLLSAAARAPRRQEQFQRNPDSYNGAVRENYAWSQDYTDLELKVPVPKHVVKGRQVSVALSSGSIRVAVLEEDGEHVLMEGKFTHKVNTESSLWSLEPGKCVLVSLNKVGEYWWSAVLEGEEHIDIDKINKERSMATVDEEEHAVLDRLTFDYHQKLQGKPQSHELKVHEMLKKGWDAEGSPFRGQRFDPAMFNISPGAVQF